MVSPPHFPFCILAGGTLSLGATYKQALKLAIITGNFNAYFGITGMSASLSLQCTVSVEVGGFGSCGKQGHCESVIASLCVVPVGSSKPQRPCLLLLLLTPYLVLPNMTVTVRQPQTSAPPFPQNPKPFLQVWTQSDLLNLAANAFSALTLDAAGFSFTRFVTMKANAIVQLQPLQFQSFGMSAMVSEREMRSLLSLYSRRLYSLVKLPKLLCSGMSLT